MRGKEKHRLPYTSLKVRLKNDFYENYILNNF